MKIVKKSIKNYTSKNGKKVSVFKLISEQNDNQTDINKERFDLNIAEVKKLYNKLLSSGKTFVLSGLSPLRMSLISDMAGNFIYQDTQEYLNGKDENHEAFDTFSQVIVTMYE